MIRKLCLVLDNSPSSTDYDKKRILTLMEDQAEKIDYYTTKNFEDSDQIREKYQHEIQTFVEENSDYIQGIENIIRRQYRGSIVILEVSTDEIGMDIVEKRVLYKKDIAAFPIIAHDGKTMLRFSQMEKTGVNKYGFRKLISPHIHDEIKFTNFETKTRVQQILTALRKNKSSFYDIVRIICKAYEIERKTRPDLKTIDRIYKEQLHAKSISKPVEESTRETVLEEEIEQFVYVNGVKYPIDEAVLLFEKQELDFQNTGIDIRLEDKMEKQVSTESKIIGHEVINGITYSVVNHDGLEQLSLEDRTHTK